MLYLERVKLITEHAFQLSSAAQTRGWHRSFTAAQTTRHSVHGSLPLRHNGELEQLFPGAVMFFAEGPMQVIDRVMQTYGMLVTLTPEEEAAIREKCRALAVPDLS
jgi:hypothetical protein